MRRSSTRTWKLELRVGRRTGHDSDVPAPPDTLCVKCPDGLKDAELGRLIDAGHYDEIREWVIHSRAKSMVAGMYHRLRRPKLEVVGNVINLNAVNDDRSSGRIITKKKSVIRKNHGWPFDGKGGFLANLGGSKPEVGDIVII